MLPWICSNQFIREYDLLLSHLSEFLLQPGLNGLKVFDPLPGRSQLILELSYLSLELPLLLLKVTATLHTAGIVEKRVNLHNFMHYRNIQ